MGQVEGGPAFAEDPIRIKARSPTPHIPFSPTGAQLLFQFSMWSGRLREASAPVQGGHPGKR